MAYPYNNPYNPYQSLYQQSPSIIWVQGIESAKAYPVGAGNSVILMDSDTSTMYIKTADNNGMPSLRVFDYVERTQGKETKINMSDYVTKKELDEALSKIAEKKKKKKREEYEDDDE